MPDKDQLTYDVPSGFELPPDVVWAVGLVTAQSAMLDECLNQLLSELLSLGDSAWFILEGQSTEWLLDVLKKAVYEADPFSRRWDEADAAAINSEIGRIRGQLRPLRNAAVHGTWHRRPIKDAEDLLPRPWDDPETKRALVCRRQRTRAIFEERWLTSSDLEQLASELAASYRRISKHWVAMQAARNHPTRMNRWAGHGDVK